MLIVVLVLAMSSCLKKDILAPDMVGMTFAAAKAELNDFDMPIGEYVDEKGEIIVEDDFDSYIVKSQSPAAGCEMTNMDKLVLKGKRVKNKGSRKSINADDEASERIKPDDGGNDVGLSSESEKVPTAKSDEPGVSDFKERLFADEFSKKEVTAAMNILRKVGCSNIEEVIHGPLDNGALTIIHVKVNGHQVNITMEDKKIFYIEITGFSCFKSDWYVNWRGKLKAKTNLDKASFSLYDTDTHKSGWIAKYDEENNRVIPWDER